MRAIRAFAARISIASPTLRPGRMSLSNLSINQPSSHSAAKARTLSTSQLVEEETLLYYNQDQFYPVHIGDVFNKKYLVIGKLGYGANSTVWLSRDISRNTYATLKVYISIPTSSIHREIQTYERLRCMSSNHPGKAYIRELLDSFEVTRANGSRHLCLVHQPLQISIWDFQYLGASSIALPVEMAKGLLRYMLCALDFLHTEANITHCDLKLSNIMLSIEDESILQDFEVTERREPCPRKVIDKDRTIYLSRNFRRPKDHAWGYPILCDFGEARIGGCYSYEEILPEVYKAPEIIMQTEWSHKVDIWNIALVAWDLIECNNHLFHARDDEGQHNNRFHIAEMIEYLGPPPKEFLRRSSNTSRVFDEKGNWKGRPPLTTRSLEDAERCLNGEDKVEFLRFMRSMLKWLPEERGSAAELLKNEWLNRL